MSTILVHYPPMKLKCANCNKKFARKRGKYFGFPFPVFTILDFFLMGYSLGICDKCIAIIGDDNFVSRSNLAEIENEISVDRLKYNPKLDQEISSYKEEMLRRSKEQHMEHLGSIIEKFNIKEQPDLFIEALGIASLEKRPKRSIYKYFNFLVEMENMSDEDRQSCKKDPAKRKETVLNKIANNYQDNGGYYNKDIKREVDIYCSEYMVWEKTLKKVELIYLKEVEEMLSGRKFKGKQAFRVNMSLPQSSQWVGKMESIYSEYKKLSAIPLNEKILDKSNGLNDIQVV
jgi:hypothetical protein